MSEEVTHSHVKGRLYNSKFSSAKGYAEQLPDMQPQALDLIKYLAEEYGDCGWIDGRAGDQKGIIIGAIYALMGWPIED